MTRLLFGRFAMVAVAIAIAIPAVVQGATAPTQSAIDNASATWAAKAKLLDAYGRPMFAELPPLSAIDNASATWAAKAKLLDVNGRPISTAAAGALSTSDAFDWEAFGIGLGAMLGMVLLAGGLGAALFVTRSHRPGTLHA